MDNNLVQMKRFWDISPDILCLVDFEHRIQDINPAFENILGYTKAEVIGRSYLDFLHAEDLAANLAESKLSPEKRVAKNFENRYRCKDGSYRWLLWNSVPVLEEGRVYAIGRDVTARKEIENNLFKSIQLLSAHMENSPVAVIEFDPEFHVIRWSGEAEKMFGWTKAEILGKSVREIKFIYDEDLEPVSHLSEDFTKGKAKSGLYKNRNYRKDGSVIYCEWYNSVISNQDGKLETVLSLVLDVTTRVKAKEELEKAKGELKIRVQERTKELEKAIVELRESNDFNLGLLECSPIAIMVLDFDSKIKYVNRQAENFLGYTKSEIIGLEPPFPWWPEDKQREYGLRFLSITKGETNQSERLLIKKNGEKIWTETTLAPVIYGAKRGLVLMNIIDITEAKRLHEELENLNHYIIQAQEEERKSIARELHEETIQMLAILKLELSSLIQSEDIKKQKTLEKIEGLIINADKAMQDVRRYSYALHPADLENLGFEAAFEKLADDLRDEGQLEVNFQVNGKAYELTRDTEIVLFRIVQEALNNIRKHARATEADITLNYLPGRIRLEIRDNGRGFNPEQVLESAPGKSNLGLLSMRERAKLIGCDLRVESAPGKGTKVMIETGSGGKG